MIACVSSILNKIAEDAHSDEIYWSDKLRNEMGIETENADRFILRQIYRILSIMPLSLIKDCGVTKIIIRDDMGENKPYYPNHGYYVNNSVTLNSDIFYNPDIPDDFIDHHGYFASRPEQTLLHEMGHGHDYVHDNLSVKNSWLALSGWSEQYRPGLKQLVIKDRGMPEKRGEWFYDPAAEFTRFYAKQSPWDDFADSFAFFMARLPDKLPEPKRGYFEALLRSYD